jgi:hypothetical protein
VRRCRPATAASPASCAAAQGGGGRAGGAGPLADRKYVIRSHANEIPSAVSTYLRRVEALASAHTEPVNVTGYRTSFRIWHRG